jgi:hypothetical protein
MEDEKEQLMRKIERSKTRIGQRPDVEKHLELAAQHRREIEHQQELANQRQEQRNAVSLPCFNLTNKRFSYYLLISA